MTCLETRDLFSALADDALTPDERAALDAHLAGCAECRRELATFARTVKLVRAIDPAHAPAGFVERVLAAAQQEPSPRRGVRRILRPWPALPLSAAALLVIGGLAVLLFRASPEQQRFARQQYQTEDRSQPAQREQATRASEPARSVESTRPAESERSTTSAPPATPAPPTPAPSGQRDAFSEAAGKPDAMAKRKEPSAPEAKRADAGPARETPARETLRRETPARETLPRATPAPAAPPATAMGDKTAAPAAERDEQRAKARSQDDAKDDAGQRANIDRDRGAVAAAKLQQAAPQIAPLSRTAATTAIPNAPPDVSAQLRTANVKGAERSLIELAARVGGRQTGRRIDGGRVVLELAVPGDAYADFVRRAAALGAVAIEHQAFERPVLAVAVTISD